jgi:hypothetical protein
MGEPRLVNEPIAYDGEPQAAVEIERCVSPVGPKYSCLLLAEFAEGVVKELAPDAAALHCRVHCHEAELHGGNVRCQRARARVETGDTHERARVSGPEMPRPGEVIIRDAHRDRVSIAEYPRTEGVGISGGDALNLDDGHPSILKRRPNRGDQTSIGEERAGHSGRGGLRATDVHDGRRSSRRQRRRAAGALGA